MVSAGRQPAETAPETQQENRDLAAKHPLEGPTGREVEVHGMWWRARHARKATAAPPDAYPATSADLDHLIDDMRELRLTLAGDLAAAAGAVDIGRDDVAADIVAADRGELAAFLGRARARAQSAPQSATPAAPSRVRRRLLVTLPAIPLAGALAVSAAAAMGALPMQQHQRARVVVGAPAAPINSTFHQFVAIVDSDPSASQVVAAATALHQQIAALIATAPDNATGVREVARLLQMEQALLLRKQPPGSAIVLAASRRLAQQLLKAAPRVAPSSTTQPTSAAVPSPTSTPANVQPSPTATHTHHAWQTATPAPNATSSPSSSSPRPTSSSSSSPGHIISFGN